MEEEASKSSDIALFRRAPAERRRGGGWGGGRDASRGGGRRRGRGGLGEIRVVTRELIYTYVCMGMRVYVCVYVCVCVSGVRERDGYIVTREIFPSFASCTPQFGGRVKKRNINKRLAVEYGSI